MPEAWEMDWAFAAWTVVSAFAIYVLLVPFSRLIGPRAFSQMTAFDFAVTVALGAIVGSTAAGRSVCRQACWGLRHSSGFVPSSRRCGATASTGSWTTVPSC